jgi:hypothetical protein
MPDNFSTFYTELNSPAQDAFVISESDSANLTFSTRAIYVGGGGNVAITTVKGTNVTFANVAGGSILPVRAQKVLSTGTTATLIVGLY